MARERLEAWRLQSRARTPFAFYATLLGAEGGRRALLERLGPEAADPIDEFMALALAHEREQAPSLVDFLAEIEAADTPIKRDMEARSDGVRVMTVHGAKGLEAPIVFLPDTSSTSYVRQTARLIELTDGDSGAPPLFVWAARKAEDSEAIAAARARALAQAAGEPRRRRYVAMTRAAQRLIVSSHHGVRGPDRDNWRGLIEAGLAEGSQAVPAPWDATETIQRLGATPEPGPDIATRAMPQGVVWPAWLSSPAPREMTEAPLKPSRAAPLAHGDEAGAARRRAGVLIHALLQRLPELAPEARRPAAERFLAAQGEALDEIARARLIERALATLARPELAPLFVAGSRAEVAIAGSLARKGAPALTIAGRIDRLAIVPDAIHIADYKNASRPQGEAPRAYVAQLALYRAALKAIYPERPIHALLIWLDGAESVELEAAELDAALGELIVSS